jgi:hypothetical protein
MTSSTGTPTQGLSPAYPEIEASDLKAARDFLLGSRDMGLREEERRTERRTRPRALAGGTGVPTVHNGIVRARHRSAARSGD